MVSEQGPATIDRDMNLAFHIVVQECIHDDVIYVYFVCKCGFCMNLGAFS